MLKPLSIFLSWKEHTGMEWGDGSKKNMEKEKLVIVGGEREAAVWTYPRPSRKDSGAENEE